MQALPLGDSIRSRQREKHTRILQLAAAAATAVLSHQKVLQADALN